MSCRTKNKTKVYQYIRTHQQENKGYPENVIDLNAMSTKLKIDLKEIKNAMKELSNERLIEWMRIQKPTV